MSINKGGGSSAPVFQTFEGSYGDKDSTSSSRLSRQAEGMIGSPNPFATPLEQALLNPQFGPQTTAEQNLINSLLDLTAGRTATRGLGAPTESAYAASIAPALVDMRNTQIANLLGAQQGATAARSADLGALLELIGYSMPQVMGGQQSTEKQKSVGIFCWVAREVYGADNASWLEFRKWMVGSSPKWFFKLYAKYGEGFAGFIKNKPTIKRIVRWWMDGRIKGGA